MAIPSEVRKTIQAIDQKIKELEETKKRLLEAFGASLVISKTNGNRPHTAVPQTGGASSLVSGMSSGDRLAMFLQEHGSATRNEIAEQSGVPSGSISYLLKSGRFHQRPDEKWEVAM